MNFFKLTAALSSTLPATLSALSLALSITLPTSQAMAADSKPVTGGTMRVHYHRTKNDHDTWGVYSWQGPKEPSKTWIADRFMFNQSDAFGGYVDIAMDTSKTEMKLLVTNGAGNKNCSSDQSVKLAADLASAGQEIWVLEADCTIHGKAPAL